MKQKPLNEFGSALYDHPIVGDIVIMREIVGPDGGELIGLTDEQTLSLMISAGKFCERMRR